MTRFDQRVGVLWPRGRAGMTDALTQWRRQQRAAMSSADPMIASDLRDWL